MSGVATITPSVAASRIRRSSEREFYVKLLIYGDPGAGKTYLGCTAPKPLILLTEPNVSDSTIKMARLNRGTDPDIWDLETWKDLEDAYTYLAEGNHPYKTVVLDSLTDLVQRIKRAVLDASVQRRPNRDPDVLEQGDWNKVQEKLTYIIRRYRDLPMHVVMTALSMDAQQEMKTVPYIQPTKVARLVPSFFNMVGVVGKKTLADGSVVHRLLIGSSDEFVTKCPEGVFPPVIDNPDLTDLFGAWEKFDKEGTAPKTNLEGEDV